MLGTECLMVGAGYGWLVRVPSDWCGVWVALGARMDRWSFELVLVERNNRFNV